jgi:hypothetical protein
MNSHDDAGPVRLELEADLIARCFASEDGQHGLGSFVDDGPGKAKFQGR